MIFDHICNSVNKQLLNNVYLNTGWVSLLFRSKDHSNLDRDHTLVIEDLYNSMVSENLSPGRWEDMFDFSYKNFIKIFNQSF